MSKNSLKKVTIITIETPHMTHAAESQPFTAVNPYSHIQNAQKFTEMCLKKLLTAQKREDVY